MMGGIPLDNRICYLFFSGYYATASASEILVKNHVENRIVKSPVMMRRGCNFTLRIDNEDTDISEYLLEREGIKIMNKIVVDGKF